LNKIIIASVSSNGIIGNKDKIPWKSRSDLKHFRHTTLDHPVLMGRKTFESIGGVLDRRVNVVLSRERNSILSKIPGVILCCSLNEAYEFCRNNKFDRIFIIGGAEIFEQTINSVDELLISRMHAYAEGDARFPIIDNKLWRLESSNKYDDFELQKYVKAL
jgi:dihydrofolate reductase